MRERLSPQGSGPTLPSNRHPGVYSKIPRNIPWLNVVCCFENLENHWARSSYMRQRAGSQRNVGPASLPSSPSPDVAVPKTGPADSSPVTGLQHQHRPHPWSCTALCLGPGCFQQSKKQGSTARNSRSTNSKKATST